ncbi:acyl-coenzyme A thioesterase 13 [Anolis carolinensis]|uniref:Acyl-coenzyme A thioesterase 13 n=1 Tax=Anolis carolinensis TaxID=28377 RepID=G1KAI0_ANOCA|nr:PREDICTED: acyl-coenzyme A thioesterase 13 [Anolis carolinensis]|eukprot:XP_016848413.1 PREDICTED: acyl-coenzyme A thioesterase 13 [Anolis carolinensis]
MTRLTLQSLREVVKAVTEASGFDRVLNKMTVLSADSGKVVCGMEVAEEHTNRGGTLHGGLTATLIDVVSTAALLHSERGAPGVSVDMNITYVSAAKIGDEILITAEILKQGKRLAFTTVDLTNKATGRLIAQGRHTKYLGS